MGDLAVGQGYMLPAGANGPCLGPTYLSFVDPGWSGSTGQENVLAVTVERNSGKLS